VLAFGWIGWWFRGGPGLLRRFRAVTDGREANLDGNRDRVAAAALVVIVFFSLAYGMISTNSKYPRTSALQGGRVRVFPNPEDPEKVEVRPIKGVYQVPGRSLQLVLRVTNHTQKPVQLGEFTAANLRFVNHDVPAAVAGVPAGYPEELLTRNGLVVTPNDPIPPGETREIKVDASDSAWETEHLASLMGGPDSSYGALLLFFDSKGKRSISEVSGPAVPNFTAL
jgi:methane/ammonia monooxygenase subunit B